VTPREVWHLETHRLGRRVLHFDRVDSTNTLAAALAQDPDNDGIAILTDEQTTGRGQHGRTWTAPPASSVLLSVLLFPPPELRRPVVLAAWAAVSVCATIRQCTGRQARIKWPNDVLVSGRKVCGILIEQARGTVVGIGLNVHQSAEAFAAAGLIQAGSLAMFTDGAPPTRDVACLLLRQLDEEYERLCQGELGTLEACWTWHTGLLGKRVVVESHDAEYRGRLREQSFDGLDLEVPGGESLRVIPELVQHLRADGV
jgi:BirA family biotin operon repressor/biotin-[acetyl-CoA-carboxylase] ligase